MRLAYICLKDIETGSLAGGEFTRRLSQSRYIWDSSLIISEMSLIICEILQKPRIYTSWHAMISDVQL